MKHQITLLRYVNDYNGLTVSLTDAGEQLSQLSPDENTKRLIGMRWAIQAAYEGKEGNAEATIDFANKALTTLPETKTNWRVAPSISLGLGYLAANELSQAERAFSSALVTSQTIDHHVAMITCFEHLIRTQIAQGQLHKAYATCQQALAASQEDGTLKQLYMGRIHLRLSDILYEWNDLTEAGMCQGF